MKDIFAYTRIYDIPCALEYKKTDHYFNIIKWIIKLTNCQSYLELGVEYGTNILNVKDFVKKCVAVDIAELFDKQNIEFNLMSTDEFFLKNKDTFDIIFIDADHNYKQVKKDFENSLKILNKFGIIIFHDTDPIAPELLEENKCSDSYKIVDYLLTRNDLNVMTFPIHETGLTMCMRKNDRRVNVFNSYTLPEISISDSDIKKSQSLIDIGDSYLRANRDIDALGYYHRSFLEYSNRRLPLYKLGEYFFNKKIWDKCIFYLEGCLNISNFDETIDNKFHYADGPYSMLYVAYWWMGNKEKSKYYFDKAVEINPYNPVYLNESVYHYVYRGNYIKEALSFKEIQFLYDESKKVNSVLEIGPISGRSTHAISKGCKGNVTIINEIPNNVDLFKNIKDFKNIKVYNMSSVEASQLLDDKYFDMIVVNGERSYDDIKKDFNLWEIRAKSLICGYNYNANSKAINESHEIEGILDNTWYKRISKFEKSIVYRKKENF